MPFADQLLPALHKGGFNKKHSHLLHHPILHTAEHFLAFLMNYQDPQTRKNKYIDQLVSSTGAASHPGL